jgi:hypothetical protein|tara:strand:- start:119 stop:1192 length:1074 start_codon:yes stop_codon:yes gene_type:complete
MAFTSVDDPSIYFNITLYTGNATDDRTVTGVGFQPDWVWIKNRTDSEQHRLQDAVRGATKNLKSSGNGAEETTSNTVKSFDSDGFTLGIDNAINGSSDAMVSWNWKANGSGSANTNGTINTTVSVNTTAGFSIVSYTSNGSASQTVGHGLGVVPNMIISKNRDTSGSTYGKWVVYSSFLPTANDKKLLLNETATASTTNEWGDADPTTSVYSVHTSGDGSTNHTSDKIIAYCFANVQGFSKCATYVGNGNADGTFVYCGFRPAWVMIKNTSSSNDWIIFDIKRDTLAPNNPVGRKSLEANDSAAEVTRTTKDMDYLSNGFKIRTSDGTQNTSGETYFFMAFAESPFVNSNGIPNNGA